MDRVYSPLLAECQAIGDLELVARADSSFGCGNRWGLPEICPRRRTGSWAEAGERRRVWLLLLALCDELHPLGRIQWPYRAMAERVAGRVARDAAIRRAAGASTRDLARRHGISPRQVRRIRRRPAR